MKQVVRFCSGACLACIAALACRSTESAPEYVDPIGSTGSSNGAIDAATTDASPPSSDASTDSGRTDSTPEGGTDGSDRVFRIDPNLTAITTQASDIKFGFRNVSCPKNAVAVGLAVNVGQAVTAGIGLRCRVVNPNGTFEPTTTTELLGSDAQAANDMTDCPDGMVMTEIVGTSGDQFGFFRIGCRAALPWAKGELSDFVRVDDLIGRWSWVDPITKPTRVETSKCPGQGVITKLEVGLGQACGKPVGGVLSTCFNAVGRLTPFCQKTSLE
jgi:hypothetical protein